MRLIHFNSNIIINLFEPRWSRESTFIARKVIKACNLKRSGVSIMLSNDRQIQKLNHKWKGKNTPEAKKAALKETPKPSDAKA